VKTLTWSEVLARRLERSFLVEPAPRRRLVEVVRAVGGVQAQVASSAELQLVTRVEELDRAGVRAELWERRSLVKSYGARGTLHLLPRDEVSMWAAALLWGRTEPWYERFGFTRRQAERIVAATGDALDGRTLTREELANEVGRRTGPKARELMADGWAHLLGPAAVQGLLCFGPPRGANVTFVRADQWLGGWEERDPWESMLEVVRRFLRAYGPTTHTELSQWIARRPPQAKELLAALADELEQVDVEGERRWVLAGDAEPGAGSGLRLVPQYDAYVIGSRPRERVMTEAARARIYSFRRGVFEGAVALQVVVRDGRIVGLWERKDGRVRVEELERLPRRALRAEAARLGGELELAELA
jgi:Winged helix DNA-binding domain